MRQVTNLAGTAIMILALAVLPTRVAAQSMACATPSAATLDDINTFKAILADTDSVRVAYRAELGLAGVSPDSVVEVTDPAVCTSVSSAVRTYLQKSGSPTENLYVVRAGPKYFALDPHGEDPAQFLLTLAFTVTEYLLP